MPIDLNSGTTDDIEVLKLEPGDTYVGIIVDIDEAPHYKYGTDEPELTKAGKPKTKWVVRLRPKDATDAGSDVKLWCQNQVKFELRQTISEHPENFLGGLLKCERLEDGQPKVKGWKGPQQWRFTLKPGPDGWTDPYADFAPTNDDPFGEDEEPF